MTENNITGAVILSGVCSTEGRTNGVEGSPAVSLTGERHKILRLHLLPLRFRRLRSG